MVIKDIPKIKVPPQNNMSLGGYYFKLYAYLIYENIFNKNTLRGLTLETFCLVASPREYWPRIIKVSIFFSRL